MSVEQEITDLRRLLREYNHAYYDLDAPLVSDLEYDRLMQRLQRLEALQPNLKDAASPTATVGGTASEKFAKVPHEYQLLSLQDVFSQTELKEFYDRICREQKESYFTVEEKIDGLSVALTYENGKLLRGVTRGDGISFGEDVTENIREVTNIPHLISTQAKVVVRGEVYMPHDSFRRLNAEIMQSDGKMFANPRNAAAGTLRQLETAVVRQRGLSFFAFDYLNLHDEFSTDTAALNFLREQGFATVPIHAKSSSFSDIWEAVEAIAALREHLPYDIDGAVIKLDAIEARRKFGNTAKAPRWAVAYKYEPEAKYTKLKDILVQVGRTGKLTPLAILEPVELSGSTVSKATLHNQNYIKALDLRIGDYVKVHKSGDIIPAITEVDKTRRAEAAKPFSMPDYCPECGEKVTFDAEDLSAYCTNLNCKAQIVRHLIYFASKDAMNISGLGEKSCEALYEGGFVTSITDIYKLPLQIDKLLQCGIIGKEKSLQNLMANIEASKNNDPARLLTGFGILHVGKETAEKLLTQFGSIDSIFAASKAELAETPSVGEITASVLYDFCRRQTSLEILQDLQKLGVRTARTEAEQAQSSAAGILDANVGNQENIAIAKLAADKKFVLTGVLRSMTRSEAENLVRRYGGKISSSVSGKTDYVVFGENAGSKLDKAVALGIKILKESEFLQMFGINQVDL